ncbi:MAG: hypothetical protein M0P17_10300 [Methanoculleus sp.]|nr:hypothetical protein [Methanoculleus sp.]
MARNRLNPLQADPGKTGCRSCRLSSREYLDGGISREAACGRFGDLRFIALETAKAHLRFIEEFQAHPVALSEGYRLLTEPVLPGDLTVSGSSG